MSCLAQIVVMVYLFIYFAICVNCIYPHGLKQPDPNISKWWLPHRMRISLCAVTIHMAIKTLVLTWVLTHTAWLCFASVAEDLCVWSQVIRTGVKHAVTPVGFRRRWGTACSAMPWWKTCRREEKIILVWVWHQGRNGSTSVMSPSAWSEWMAVAAAVGKIGSKQI